MLYEKIKIALFNACVEFVNGRDKTIHQTVKSNQKGLSSETKSSAGDKHEIGRAMLQLEIEMAVQQLEVVYQMKATLARIRLEDNSEIVKLGSLVLTNQLNYFIAISAGEIKISQQKYYAVSLSSPIGKILLGKKVNDKVLFNRNIILINKIF